MLKPKYTVHHSIVVDTNPEKVWTEVRDIMQLLAIVSGGDVKNPRWVNGGSAEKVPSMYEFTLASGGDVVKEEVIGRSEHERSLTYRLSGEVLGIIESVATYRVVPVTTDPNRSFIEWSREFRVVEGTAPEFFRFLEELIDQGMEIVKAHFSA